MPIRIRWKSKEYLGVALMLLGACGMFQVAFIFVAQYFFNIGNYLVVIIIPVGITMALFFATLINTESFKQVERRKKIRSQFQKSKGSIKRIRKLMEHPIVKPLLSIFIIFTSLYVISFVICIVYLDVILSFIIAENFGTISSLLAANFIEKNYAKVRRY